ncbi:MAG TPA: hypothetical protein VFT39_16665 [Vicinamibacterales bacterium]|nr:hypothetical protein [Vicinamibacterales bacterium]
MTKPQPDGSTRELLRALIVVMNDVEALKIAYLSSPMGYGPAQQKLAYALDATSHRMKPFLDALNTADDQELLKLLGAWKGGLTL